MLRNAGVDIEVGVSQDAARQSEVDGEEQSRGQSAGSVITLAHGIRIPSLEEYYGLSSAIDTQANTYLHIDQNGEITYRSIIAYGDCV